MRAGVTNLELTAALSTLPTIRLLIDFYQEKFEAAMKERGYTDEEITEVLNEPYTDQWSAPEDVATGDYSPETSRTTN